MQKTTRHDKLLNLIKLTRISEWWLISFSFILFAFIPYIYRLNFDMKLEYIVTLFSTPPLYIMIVIVFSAQTFLFASNNYFDRHVDNLDEIKRDRNPICSGKVSRSEIWLLLVVTAGLSIFFAFLYNVQTLLFTNLT